MSERSRVEFEAWFPRSARVTLDQAGPAPPKFRDLGFSLVFIREWAPLETRTRP